MAGRGSATLDSRFRGNDEIDKENSTMDEPIKLEIFTDYV